MKPRETVVPVSLENLTLGLHSPMAGRSINGAEIFSRAAGMKRASRFMDGPYF